MAVQVKNDNIVRIGQKYFTTPNKQSRTFSAANSKVENFTDASDNRIVTKITEFVPSNTTNPNIYYSTDTLATLTTAINANAIAS